MRRSWLTDESGEESDDQSVEKGVSSDDCEREGEIGDGQLRVRARREVRL